MIAKNKKPTRQVTRTEITELGECIGFEHPLGSAVVGETIVSRRDYTAVEINMNLGLFVIHGNTVKQNLVELKSVLDMWINDLIKKQPEA